jgi:rod shape-determining protein MreB
MVWDRFVKLFSKDLAMDLGTANTLIYVKGEGIVLNEPSVVAVNVHTNRTIAVGNEAKEFMGRTPQSIRSVRPLRDGVIADFDLTNEMIKYFFSKVRKRRGLFRPKIVIGVPTGITQVEKKAVIEAAENSGARDVFLVEEPMAAAIGAGLEINKPSGTMIVDIGGGTTEVAVISLWATAYSESVRVAGDETNEAIMRYVQRKWQILIGENTAEQIKIAIGTAIPSKEPKVVRLSGKDLITSYPKTIEINEHDVREAIEEPVNAIIEAIRRALAKTPPELVVDIKEKGITLAGGGALLRRLDELIYRETHIEARRTENPLLTVALGCGACVEDIKYWKRVFVA